MLHVHDDSLQPITAPRCAQHVTVAAVSQRHLGLHVGAEPWGPQGAVLSVGHLLALGKVVSADEKTAYKNKIALPYIYLYIQRRVNEPLFA